MSGIFGLGFKLLFFAVVFSTTFAKSTKLSKSSSLESSEDVSVNTSSSAESTESVSMDTDVDGWAEGQSATDPWRKRREVLDLDVFGDRESQQRVAKVALLFVAKRLAGLTGERQEGLINDVTSAVKMAFAPPLTKGNKQQTTPTAIQGSHSIGSTEKTTPTAIPGSHPIGSMPTVAPTTEAPRSNGRPKRLATNNVGLLLEDQLGKDLQALYQIMGKDVVD